MVLSIETHMTHTNRWWDCGQSLLWSLVGLIEMLLILLQMIFSLKHDTTMTMVQFTDDLFEFQCSTLMFNLLGWCTLAQHSNTVPIT